MDVAEWNKANITAKQPAGGGTHGHHPDVPGTQELIKEEQGRKYPTRAIREIIRNAVVHRQYSLTGKDIKIAVYDDMVEVTSPGLLPPSIDYADMESRQSDARNKVIAPVFKRLGIIDQWGNGLKLVSLELRKYPGIELKWKEVGLSFQVQFIKKNNNTITAKYDDGGNIGGNVGGNDDLTKKILTLIRNNDKITIPKIASTLNISKRNCERLIAELKNQGNLPEKGPQETEAG